MKAVATALILVVLAALGGSPAAASSPPVDAFASKRCRGIRDAGPTGRDPADVKGLRARKVSCRRARRVARNWINPFSGRTGRDGRKRFGPWSCADTIRRRQSVRCRARGGRRVSFYLG